MALLLTCGGAMAQSPSKVYRIGFLIASPWDAKFFEPAITRAFADRGYVLGTNFVFDIKAASGKLALLPGLADELVADQVDLIMTRGYPSAVAAKERAPKIPVVVSGSGDRVALGVVIQPLGVHAPNDFAAAFAAHEPPDAIMMLTDALTILNRQRVVDFAAERKIAAIFEVDSIVREGGLMSYGPDGAALLNRAVGLADRLLKGANAADLPLELPTKFVFAINLRTAKTLGLDVPESIVLRADQVVE
jgi:ABC-type uncharacterized transport system substrate-binding protein